MTQRHRAAVFRARGDSGTGRTTKSLAPAAGGLREDYKVLFVDLRPIFIQIERRFASDVDPPKAMASQQ